MREQLCVTLLMVCACAHFPATNNYDKSCIHDVSIYEVRGASVSGVFEPGEKVTVLEGYQACNDLRRNDVVLYRFAGNEAPLIKIVQAVPGDRWHLAGGSILVNDKVLKNAQGIPYVISDTRMLELYAHDYPVIPKDVYLILGNLSRGSADATRFGLVGKADILGKVVRSQKR